MRSEPWPTRSRTRGQRTATAPMPVMISRSGRCPCRTSRWRPSSVTSSACLLSKAPTSASTACASSARAPSRKISVSGSAKVPGWESWKTLVSVTAYHSFDGEVEASNTPTIRRLIPSCRHQLSPIAPIVDIHERSPTYFDVRKSFAGAVPLVMYLKWSFRGVCWTHPEINACIIIDDPLLRRRYGYLDFREILQLMGKNLFTMTIAFIPWNWRRTDRETVELFHQNRGRLSVCVHGCDHTGGEFATQSAGVLDRKLKTAKSRMTSLFERSGLLHDPVMV